MRFSDIIGQEDVKQRLLRSVHSNRVSHAQLFCGPAGSGKLALALAYAQYVSCPNRTATDSCGECPSCQKYQKLTHPDLHFVFPTATTKTIKSNPESDLFLDVWRQYVLQNSGYVDLSTWYEFLDVENKQGLINVREAATLIRKLSFKSYEGDYKVVIIWMAEKLGVDTANKLLKLLEEPPEKTLFLLIAEDSDKILTTIRSRTILTKILPINQQSIATALVERYGCTTEVAYDASVLSEGNWLTACRCMSDHEEERLYFTTFQQWMRLCYRRSIKELIDFSENVKGLGRERQKRLLAYGVGCMRNSLLVNHGLTSLVMLPQEERKFNVNFAPFINARNIMGIVEVLEEAARQVERNGYAPLIFMDCSFKITKLLTIK